MGLLQDEYRSYERQCVAPELPESVREDVRLTFFAGAAVVLAFIAQGLRERPHGLAGLLKCLALDIADEGERGGFDWSFMAETMPEKVDDANADPMLLSLFERLTPEQQGELRALIRQFISRCLSMSASVN
ncbi:hypothetical protein WK62_27890 [Burkholderia ubonensis]|uniref:hypothetical protein n=1 Tax=Burkholderia ubonensis TaxID=101571 RepID=UPI000751D1AB|nr:hypothetical protein [Burkholderia ubonensis]KVU15702.1 hypothetical protein WK62_27890 [Burkholderia ubonensis]